MGEERFRKELAERLAGKLKDSTLLPLLQFLSHGAAHQDWGSATRGLGPFASLAEDTLGSMTSQSTGRRSVGIWEEEAGTGDFIRSRTHIDLWRFCADVDRIPRKGARKRVVLLGESVARGFFFDPLYSPACVLQELLSCEGDPVEVIDLAQSNCDPWWLTVVMFNVSFLEPDAIVVFAGNNWRGEPLANLSAEHYSVDGPLITTDGGFAELLKRQRQRLEKLASQTFAQLSLAAGEAGAPLVFIIPELNLADWTNCPVGTLDLPLMSDHDTRRWVAAYGCAANALQAGSPAEAEHFIREVVKRDGGASSACLDLLARAQLSQRKVGDAWTTLRRSRDLTLCFLDGTRPVPGIFPGVADTIRRMGREVGAAIVDLPQIFSEYSHGEIPGRRLFLDYCHLSSEGIRVAMAAAARTLNQLLFSRERELADLVDQAPSPAAEQEAWAHLLAGIHNAHWGQNIDICSYHFSCAAGQQPALEESVIPRVYDTFRRGVPPTLLSSFNELVQNKMAAVYLLGYGSGFRSFGLVSEHRLLMSLLFAFPFLENVSPDPDFSLGHIPEIDLMAAHWSELTDGNRWFQRGFAAAYHPETTFPFVCDTPRPLSLGLTFRIPGSRETGNLSVELNGTPIATVDVHGNWHSVRLTTDASIVKHGVNLLTLRWPNIARTDLRPQLRSDFDTGRQLDARTHFGHIQDLRISVV